MAIPSKRVSEVITAKFDFSDQIRFAEVISSPVVTVEIFSGIDPFFASILLDVATVSGSVASQKIQFGQAGVTYTLTCTVTGSTGTIYKLVQLISILSDAGSYTPSSFPTLTGILPTAVIGVPYSQPLQIAGGYPPYAPDGVVLGTAPTWMGFTVVGNQLICAGTPNESVPTAYTFTPQIRDAALNLAVAPQQQSLQVRFQQVMGTQTAQATLTGDDRVCTINYDSNPLLVDFVAASYGIIPPGTVGFGKLNSALVQSGNGTYTVQAGSPGDNRLFSLGQGINRWAFSSDDNFGYAELWSSGLYQTRVKRISSDADNWFGIANGGGQDGAFANTTWIDSTHAYVGVRRRGSIKFARIYKWSLISSATTILADAISPELAAGTNGHFYTHIDREGVLRSIDGSVAPGSMSVIDRTNLTITSTIALTSISLTDIRAFAVDLGVLYIYFGGATGQLRAYSLPSLTLIGSTNITGTVYGFNEKLLATDDSLILQSGVNIKRISYLPV